MGADHYETLGVSRNASKADIKNAFFRQAHRYHPDHHPSASAAARAEATTRFRQAKDAYDVLSDDRRRAAYDHDLRYRNQTRGGHGGSGAGASSSSSSSSNGHAHGNNTRHGHAGGSRARPPPPPNGGGSKARSIRLIVWAVIVVGMAIFEATLPDPEPEDERITRVWRVPMAEYQSSSFVAKGMVSAWNVRKELSKKKWWMEDAKWPIGRKM